MVYRDRRQKCPRLFRVVLLGVAVAGEAPALEPAELVVADGLGGTVVVLRLGALVKVLHPGDGVEGAVDVEVAVADVVAPGLDDVDELPLDVAPDDLGPEDRGSEFVIVVSSMAGLGALCSDMSSHAKRLI